MILLVAMIQLLDNNTKMKIYDGSFPWGPDTGNGECTSNQMIEGGTAYGGTCK